jgi:ribonuclease HI
MSTETIIAYTDGGSVDVNGSWYGGYGIYTQTPSGTETITYQGMPVGTTNNRAEIQGLVKLYEMAVSNNWMHVTAHLDSQLVLKGNASYIKGWMANGWKTQAGEPVKNVDLWKNLYSAKQTALDKGIVFDFKWVKGHSGIKGNDYADDGAKKATAKSIAGDYDLYTFDPNAPDEPVVAVEPVEDTKPGKKEKVKKAPPYNPLLCGNKLLDVTNVPGRDPRIYYTTTAESAAKKDVKHRFIGVSSADRFEGVVMLDTPDPIMETIRDCQDRALKLDYQIPVIYNWSTIISAKNWQVFYENGASCLIPTKRGDLDFWDKDTEISYVFRTARCAWFALDTMDVKLKLLQDYLASPDKYTVVDVTDKFLTVGPKGKKEIPAILGKVKRVDLSYKYDPDKRAIVIPLVQDKSIPDRNTFSRILKQDKDFTVHVMFYDVTPKTLRWACIVKTPSGIGIYNNPSTNLVLIP